MPVSSNNAAAFGAASSAMTELAVSSGIGMACVQQSLVDATTISALSRTTFNIFLPMFLATAIFKTISTYQKSISYIVPLLGIAHPYCMCMLARHVLLPLFGIDGDSDDGRCTIVCSGWGNTSVVPLLFAESLFRSKPDLIAKSYAQISLFVAGWSPFFWAFGREVLLGGNQPSGLEDKGTESLLDRIRKCVPPPVIGVLVGILASTTPIRHLFVEDSSSSSTIIKAPLAAVYNTVQNFGKAACPASLLVMTSSLAMGVGVGKNRASCIQERTKKDDTTEVGLLRIWSCVSLARFLLSPAIMFGMLKGLESLGVLSGPNKNPMLWFIMMIQGCMPPAQNLVLMLQVSGKRAKAEEMAKFLFSTYATSMIPVVIILTLALEKFGLA